VVYRLGFAPSRSAARQLVGHGHICVNGRRCDIPSRKVDLGDVIEVRDRKGSRDLVRRWIEAEEDRVIPDWLQADPERLRGEVRRLPTRDDVSLQINEQLIVEFCSR